MLGRAQALAHDLRTLPIPMWAPAIRLDLGQATRSLPVRLKPEHSSKTNTMTSGLAILAIGFLLGMRHATDPDHVIAVSTIVSRERSIVKAGLIGVLWGVGHTLTILVVGAAIILFGVAIPTRVGLTMEFSVGLMLILLGILNLDRRDGVDEREIFARAPEGDRRPRAPSRARCPAALSLAFARREANTTAKIDAAAMACAHRREARRVPHFGRFLSAWCTDWPAPPR